MTRALPSVLLVVSAIVATACKDESGTAQQVSPARTRKPSAAEPPGGPPSCAEVGVHLGAALDVPREVHANARGVDVSMSGDSMRAAINDGIVAVCREAAWSQPTRACALAWQGNILRERARLSEACPGTVTR